MAENQARKGSTRNGARDNHDGSYRGDRHDREMTASGRSTPADRSLDRVMRFYSDPTYQVAEYQPRD
jgi:hypothetical protein